MSYYNGFRYFSQAHVRAFAREETRTYMDLFTMSDAPVLGSPWPFLVVNRWSTMGQRVANSSENLGDFFAS